MEAVVDVVVDLDRTQVLELALEHTLEIIEDLEAENDELRAICTELAEERECAGRGNEGEHLSIQTVALVGR